MTGEERREEERGGMAKDVRRREEGWVGKGGEGNEMEEHLM